MRLGQGAPLLLPFDLMHLQKSCHYP
jgi:hypothetical protein